MINPLGERWYPLRYHPTQYKLLTDPVRFPVVPAGRRSGKTELAKRAVSRAALTEKTTHTENYYFCGAPTREQAKRIYWDDIKALTKKFWSKQPNESDLIVYTKFDDIISRIQVLGLEKPERIEGSPWNGGVIDEMRKIKEHTWPKHVRPALSDRDGWCWRCGVPEGRNHYHKAAVEASGGMPVTVPLIGAFSQGEDPESAYYSWHSADILPKKEIESARKMLDPSTFRQEYEGSFEATEGRVYYGYESEYYPHGNLDESIKYDPNLPIVMGFDFNVNPMTAVLGHVRRGDKNQQEYHLFKGYFLKNSNTRKLAEKIVTEYSDTRTFILTPCQSSSARQTSQEIGKTDLKIIKDVFLSAGKTIQINKRSKNPPVKSKIQATNAMLYHNRLRLNPKCDGLKELIADWEGLIYKEGTSDIDHTDKMRGHISDACGYVCEKNWPIKVAYQQNPELGIIV